MHISKKADGATTLRASQAGKWLMCFLVVLQACFCWSVRRQCLAGATDMRAFYGAGIMVTQGHLSQLYEDEAEQATQQAIFKDRERTLHFLYPAFAALAFVPLTYLSYPTAFMLFLLFNLLCIFLSTYLLVGDSASRVQSAYYLLFMVLCCFPAGIALMQGQLTFFLLLIFTASYTLEGNGYFKLAGLVLAFGLVKFQFVLPVIFLYLVWKKYRVVFGFLGGALALMVLSLTLMGAQGTEAYLSRLHSLGQATLVNPENAHLRYGMQTASEPNLHGLIVTLTGSGALSIALTVIISFAVIAWSCQQRPSLVTALPAALLVSYHMQPYDLTLLCFPLILLCVEMPRSATMNSLRERRFRFAGAGLLAFPAAPLLLLTGYGSFLALASFVTLVCSARSGETEADQKALPVQSQDAIGDLFQHPSSVSVAP